MVVTSKELGPIPQVVIEVDEVVTRGNPEHELFPCFCCNAGDLVYSQGPWENTHFGRTIRVGNIWGFRCDSDECDFVAFEPVIREELREKIIEAESRK